ncbi:Hsp20/alpha crystallin family protein [Danxiaibacter flavus]|uniref:Hsp20/alpha crystallin family protein n=1 Tax=Danxiaibacter flavus TaxID=3049108 RepID=A0ABV3ZI45_9BACT|nr:Hsp20/alpha crystallin family protein [Chitinophagaceae bacterium DXS]
MSLVKRNSNNQSAVPSLFDDFFSREFFNWGNNNYSATRTTVPAVNVKETNEEFEVEVAAPGMSKEDFNITLDHNYLTISSSKQQEQNSEEHGYTRREFSYQSFSRSFELPTDVVDGENIKATYDNGLLRLVIPKKEEAKQKGPKTIQVS